PRAMDHGTKYISCWGGSVARSATKRSPYDRVGSSEPAAHVRAPRDPNWGGLLMENLQSLIAQFLGVAFAILGQLNDYLGHRRGHWVLAVNQAELAEGGVERLRASRANGTRRTTTGSSTASWWAAS